MKTHGKCPKCGGTEIRRGKRGGYSAVTGIEGWQGWISAADTTAYVCVDCGFVEEYLTDKSLKKIER